MPKYAPELARQVLTLRRAGVPFNVIAEQVQMTERATKAVFEEALGAHDDTFHRALENDRLDRMHAAIWPKAVEGDLDAIDRVVRISERRERVSLVPKDNDHQLRKAFDQSAATADELRQDVDAALIEAGRKIADRVDEAVATSEGVELTKALYLIPHMMNVLREMQATPASRTAARAAAPPSVEPDSKLAQLRAIRGKRPAG